MPEITFAIRPEYGAPYCLADDPRMQTLGNWMTTDISIYKSVCLDALATVADAEAGRPTEPWDSDNYEVHFSSSAMSFQNKWVETTHGEYTITEAREAIEDYWRFLVSIPDNPDLIREFRPDLPEWQADLLQWEDSWKRPHPYRGKLF
ncbi:hypothetical protein ACH35V_41515 [Actinomadura sp. 1N219]|uniref:hypothetical protein n=1 Tax=Actinomadura sp. 1N219 TaxID=3375152 RepID=UPI0037875DAF